MKTIQSTLQLEQPDLTAAISTYLKLKGYELMEAVVQNNVILARVSKAMDSGTKSLAKLPGTVHAKITRKVRKHQKINTGLFTVLKQWFEEERKAGTTEIPFHTIKTKIAKNYPNLSEDRLGLYLYDRRQLPDVRYKKSEGVVRFI